MALKMKGVCDSDKRRVIVDPDGRGRRWSGTFAYPMLYAIEQVACTPVAFTVSRDEGT